MNPCKEMYKIKIPANSKLAGIFIKWNYYLAITFQDKCAGNLTGLSILLIALRF